MKETGLMFKAPLVRSILDDIKLMTRRIAKDVKHPGWGNVYTPSVLAREPQHTLDAACPYGGPGDRIYVRETHAQVLEPDIPTGRPRGPKGTSGIPARPEWQSHYVYLADGEMPPVQWHHLGDSQPVRWTPSILMPKRAARIWLDITGVRLERLQDISEADCRAEGAHGGHGSIPGYAYSATPLEHFQHIWTSTGGDWAANPWVWVIDFKRIHNHKATP